VRPPEKDAARCSSCLGARKKCSWGDRYRIWRVAQHLCAGDVSLAELEVQRAHDAGLLVESGKGVSASPIKPKGSDASPSKRKRGGKEREGGDDDVLPVAEGKGKGKEVEQARPLKPKPSKKDVARSEDRGEGPSGVSYAPVIVPPAARSSNSAVAALEARVKESEEALRVANGKEAGLGALVAELCRQLQGREGEIAQMRVAVEHGERRFRDLQGQMVTATTSPSTRRLGELEARLVASEEENGQLREINAQMTEELDRVSSRMDGKLAPFPLLVALTNSFLSA
jgi:hypothetical protein